MKEEVISAARFVCEKLKENYHLSDEQCELFKTTLEELMFQRFENHWHPDKPMKGNAYRCLNINHEECVLDPMLKEAAVESFIDIEDLKTTFPNGLALWVDPYDVSYRMGRGYISPIFKKYNPNRTVSTAQNRAKFSRNPTTRVAAGQRHQQNSDVVSNSKLNTSAPSFVPSSSKPSKDLSNIWTKNWQNGQQRWNQNSSSQEFYSHFQVNSDQGVYNRFHWHRDEQQPQEKKLAGRGFEFRNVAQEAY